MKTLPVMTPEQVELFREFADRMPGAITVEWERVAIDVVNGRRFLCLQAVWQEGQRSPIYVHFHPDGASEADVRAASELHGLPHWTPV